MGETDSLGNGVIYNINKGPHTEGSGLLVLPSWLAGGPPPSCQRPAQKLYRCFSFICSHFGNKSQDVCGEFLKQPCMKKKKKKKSIINNIFCGEVCELLSVEFSLSLSFPLPPYCVTYGGH